MYGHHCVLASRRMAVHTSLQGTRSPEGMSSSKIERRRSKPPGQAEQGARTGASTARMPAVRRSRAWKRKRRRCGPARGHLAAAPLADAQRPAEPAPLPGRQACEACERMGASAAKRRSGGGEAGAEVTQPKPVPVFKLHLYLSCLPGILCLLLGGQNGRSRSVLSGRSRTAKMAGQPRVSLVGLKCTRPGATSRGRRCGPTCTRCARRWWRSWTA